MVNKNLEMTQVTSYLVCQVVGNSQHIVSGHSKPEDALAARDNLRKAFPKNNYQAAAYTDFYRPVRREELAHG